ncbi:hypothetical protein FOXYSP1_17186 [Fusarium oxysporum f. sp. phaseoli]
MALYPAAFSCRLVPTTLNTLRRSCLLMSVQGWGIYRVAIRAAAISD